MESKMIKLVHQKLKDSSVLDHDDQVLSIIQVNDLLKKEKPVKKATKEDIASSITFNKYFLVATSKFS